MVVIQTIRRLPWPYPGSLVWLWYASKTGFDHYYGCISHRSQSVRWFSALRSRYSEIVSDCASNRFQTLVHYKIPAALPYFFAGLRVTFLCFLSVRWFQNG